MTPREASVTIETDVSERNSQPIEPSHRYLTPAQYQQYSGFSRSKAAQDRQRGTGPAFISINRRTVRYDVNVVDEWMASRRVDAAA